MKRTHSWFALAVLFVAAIPFQAVHAAGVGDLIMCPESSSVYYLAEDGKRHVFPNENIFFSWYPDFENVKTISCTDLARFQIGGRIVYQGGTNLVKLQSDPSVFAVESDGVLREIPNEEIAKELFGDDWAKRVDDVSEAFWGSFTVGSPLAQGEIPEGTILSNESGDLFRTTSEGEAVEIDPVLDTDDEDVWEDFALSVEDIEDRLEVIIELLRTDANTSITLLQILLESLQPVDVEDEDEVEIEEIDEIEDEESAEQEAADAISDAEEEIREAEGDILEDEQDGKDISQSESLIASAEMHLALAKTAFAAGDYASAESHADEAKHDAMWARGKAVDSVLSDDDDEAEDESEDEAQDEIQDEDELDDEGGDDSADTADDSDDDGTSEDDE